MAARQHTLFRFSLYGFLKNQTYYEPFLILVFLEKGLSFFQIGLLIGFRELCINVLEVPSGALADLYGRRKAMIGSFLAYIVSFILFATATAYAGLFLAMALFACGEVFRTGTHKAMIFDWLEANGRQDEGTQTYGYTRSWSKLGSAVAVVIATAFVFWRGRYSDVFWLCIIPYAANIVNFLGYPNESEGTRHPDHRERRFIRHLWASLEQAWRNRAQRRLLFEAIGFDGAFKVSKDYLQPVLKAAVLTLPVFLAFPDAQRTALLVGAVYCVLHLASSVASRHAHVFTTRSGGDTPAARLLWYAVLVLYALLVPALIFRHFPLAILVFVLIYVVQNVWRPGLIARLNACSESAKAATTLSIESQARSAFAMVAAPLLGLAVDSWGIWLVGVFGAALAAIALVAGPRGREA